MEAERERRIDASTNDQSDEGKARMVTYNKLIDVQEDLLKRIRTMKVGGYRRELEYRQEGCNWLHTN